MRALLLTALLLTLTACGRSGDHEETAQFIRLPAESAQMSAAYLTISSEIDDRLVSASIEGVTRTEIHTVINEDGVMRMRPLADGISIGAGESVTLKPGGLHLMLIGLEEPFVEGESREVTLRFESGREDVVALPVSRQGTGQHKH